MFHNLFIVSSVTQSYVSLPVMLTRTWASRPRQRPRTNITILCLNWAGARRSGAPEVLWKPERRSGTYRQVEGGAPRFLPFRLRFSDKLMLNLCDILFFAGYYSFASKISPQNSESDSQLHCLLCVNACESYWCWFLSSVNL